MAQKLLVTISGDASSLSRAFGKAAGDAQTFGQKLAGVGSRMTSVGKSMTLGITLPLAAAGVASFKMADDFETSMSRVIGLAGKSEEQVGRWGKELLTLGPKLGRSPRELAEALYFVASSGVSVSKTMGVVRASAQAASAGLGETQQIADTLTSVMNAYGESNISAAQAADILVATVREGKGEASEFAPVLGNVTAFASKLKVGFDEVGAALAAMTQLGTDPATAATQLSAFFSSMLKTTDKAEAAFQQVGLSSEGLARTLQSQGLLATLQKIRDAFGGNTEAMARAFPNIRALRALFGLLDADGNRVEGIFKRMGESSGSLAKAFEESTKRTGFTMEKFKASVEAAGIAIGSILAPVVADVATILTRLSIAFQNLDPEVQKIIIGIAAAAAVIGPLLIVVGSLVGAVGALLPVFLAIASPIGIVVLAVAALTAAIVAAVVWPDKLRGTLEKMGLSAKDARSTVEALQNAFTAIKAVVSAVMPAILSIVKPALDLIKGALMIVAGILRGDFSQAWEGIKVVVAAQLKLVVALMTAFPRVMLGLALQVGVAIVKGIGDGLRALPAKVKEGFAALPGVLAGIAGQAAGWAADIGRAIINGVLSGLGGLASAIKDKVSSAVGDALSHIDVPGFSPVEQAGAKAIGEPIITGAVKGVESKKAALAAATAKAAKEALDAATEAVKSAQGIFASAFDGLVSNALSAFDRLSAEIETRTERKLRLMDEKAAAASLQQAKRDAEKGLAEAQVAFSLIPITDTEALGKATQDILAAQQALATAEAAITRAKLEKRAVAERQAEDARRERQRVAFETQLTNLETAYANQEISTQEFHRRMIALFKKFEVPLGKAAQRMGAAIAKGLNDSLADVEAAAEAVATAIEKRMNRIKVIVTIGVHGSDDGRPAGRAVGGPVRAGTPYIVGEVGPELFVPSHSGTIHTASETARMAGGGGMVVNLLFHGPTVGTSREFEDTVRRALYDVGRRNPGSGLALA